MSFKDLKKNSTNIEKLTQELEKMNKPSFEKDARLWTPERDKTGNGFAIIRFLPSCSGEDIPWVKVYSHSFQGPGGKWYIQNCPTTLGGKCKICEENSKLWNSGAESDKEIARSRKRKTRWYSNVYVLKDQLHPENEGQIKIFNYGKKIFDKINESMNPQFPDEPKINPFCFWKGRDFKIKITTISGFANYDKSEFAGSSPFMGGDDAKLEKIYNSLYPLQPFVDPKEFKSYDELVQIYNNVMEINSSGSSIAEERSRNLGVIRQTNSTTFGSPTPISTTKAETGVEQDDESILNELKAMMDDES